MNDALHTLSTIVTRQHIFNVSSALIIFIVGIYASKRADTPVEKLTQLDPQQRMLFSKFLRYGIITLAIAMALSQLGFDLKVILGAAGVLTVAVGFAAQTSASNLISGIFLMVERPFITGDVVRVGDIEGVIISVDLLSTKMRTPNNVMVRVPNETMVKSNIVNFTHFPIRRVELNVGVGYGSDLSNVERVCLDLASEHPLCLEEPEPQFLVTGFGDSSINVQLNVWTLVTNIIEVKNDLLIEIKNRFDTAKIDIPFPTRTLLMPELPPAKV